MKIHRLYNRIPEHLETIDNHMILYCDQKEYFIFLIFDRKLRNALSTSEIFVA